MSLINEQEKYWDKVAATKIFPVPFKMDKFECRVSHEMRILDVGCGYGRTLNELYIRGYKNIFGTDYSQGMINRGKQLFPYIDLRKNENTAIPFPDKSFEAVILIAVLTCIAESREQKNLIYEIQRVLKDDGTLYVSDYLLNHDRRNLERYNRFQDIYETYGIFRLPEGAVVRHHSEDYIMELLNGFEKLEFQSDTYNTMNGHKSNGFFYMGRKNKR